MYSCIHTGYQRTRYILLTTLNTWLDDVKKQFVVSHFTADKGTKFCSSQNCTNIIPVRNQKEAQTNYHEIGVTQIIGECLTSAGVSQTVVDIIMQSWRPATTKQYGCYLKRWVQFCHEQKIEKISLFRRNFGLSHKTA